MPAISSISSDKLLRLIGTPAAPAIVDLRSGADFAGDPRRILGAARRNAATISDWAGDYHGRNVVVACAHGKADSEGAAAWLRASGADAELLEGGVSAWLTAGYPMVPEDAVPRNNQRRTIG